MAVDTDGRLLMVNLTHADLSDSVGVQMILDTIRKRGSAIESFLKRTLAGSDYVSTFAQTPCS